MKLELFVALLCSGIMCDALSRHSFTAAVFEHARIDSTPNGTPESIVEANLDYYRRAAGLAKAKGADIIVFPELGLFPPNTREGLRPFLENIPNPEENTTNPCEQRPSFSERPILHALSCIARSNSIVVVANMGDVQPCEGHQDCRPDGMFQFNTNVAFGRDGTLLSRYHKEHLFFEDSVDLPLTTPQNPTFRTDFGTFAMFICFDILFKEVVDFADVDGVLLPTMWNDGPPFLTSVQLWNSWAMGNNATFLAANIQIPGQHNVGSGVFDGHDGALAYTYNPDGLSKLVVAAISREPQKVTSSSITVLTESGAYEHDDQGLDVPVECSRRILGEPNDVRHDYRCLEQLTGNYSFAKLTQLQGQLEVCNNGMCCSLAYTATSMDEDYYFGVFNGTYTVLDRYAWWEETCLLARCDSTGNSTCSTFPLRSQTRFRDIEVRANFSTTYVYPSVMFSRMRLAPVEDWSFQRDAISLQGYLSFKSVPGEPVLIAGLYGRRYDLDPPYQ